jgi:FlaA1/EpsC-like NDP-sugar epimerase
MRRWQIRPWRILLGFMDILATVVALTVTAVAYWRGMLPPELWQRVGLSALIAAAALVTANTLSGLYNRVWQYATADTVVVVALSVWVSQAAAALVGRWLVGGLPALMWVTTALALLVLSGGTRFFWRMVRPRLATASNSAPSPVRALVYGANSYGHHLINQLHGLSSGRYLFLGFLDDDPAKQGAWVGRGRVLGGLKDLERLAARYEVQEVIIAAPEASREQVREIYEACRRARVRVRIMPHPLETLHDPNARPVREINVEDLLGRELSSADIRLSENYLAGKSVLVTGAGGSIGSELCRQICRYGPRQVLLLGRGENRIHWIYWQLRQHYPEVELVPVVANLAAEDTMDHLLQTFAPEIIVHAAAHKHVYLMEFVPVEAARNNVLATARLADLAEAHGVERLIFISTDKAARPCNVMGATKRMGELLLTLRPFVHTAYLCVRFGNVLGSEGSVLEIFKRQWQRNEPLTVTHPEATRYFMSIPEASFLVLQAGALGQHGDIFVLDMGEPLRILDLAREFIALQGGDPDTPGAIKFTGLRPGEKLHEELCNPGEQLLPTSNPHISRLQPPPNLPTWEQMTEYLRQLQEAVARADDGAVCAILSAATGAQLNPHHAFSYRYRRPAQGREKKAEDSAADPAGASPAPESDGQTEKPPERDAQAATTEPPNIRAGLA